MNTVGHCKYLKQAQLLIFVTGHATTTLYIIAAFINFNEKISRKSLAFLRNISVYCCI